MPDQHGGGGSSLEQKRQAERNAAGKQRSNAGGAVDKKLNGPNRPSV